MSSRKNIQNDIFHAYEKAVMGTARARHTYLRRLKTISDLAGGLDGKKVLDVGCGYGFRTLGLLREGAQEITGIDLDQNRIFAAKNFALEKKLDRVAFLEANCQNLGMRSRCFDLVVADEMVHHLENLGAAFREMYRVLRPSGIAVISDHNRLSIPSEIVRTICFGRNKEKVFSATQIQTMMKRAGFNDIKFKHIIFTLPLARLKGKLLKVNSVMESLIERMPLLRMQCGVYVIRGIK